MLSAIRRICVRGHAHYLCIPRAMIAALDWPPGVALTVEVIGPASIRVRVADVADLSHAHVPSSNFVVPREAGK